MDEQLTNDDGLTPWVLRINAAVTYKGSGDHEDVRSILKALLATEYDRGKVEVFERMVKVYETYPGWKTIKKIMESKPVDADALFSWIETMDTELAHEIGKLEDELKSKGESK